MVQLLRSSLATKIVRVSGVLPSNALSVAAENKILLKNIKRISPVCFEAEILSRDEARIRLLLQDNYKIEILSKKGTAYAFIRLAKRYTFVLGMLLAIVALFVFSKRVMIVKVYGSDDKQIYDTVKNSGVIAWHGAAKNSLQAATDSVMQIDGVIWANIEIKGICANVFVQQEKQENELAASGPIVAKSDGVVKNLIVYSGTPMVKNGDTVFSGQVLVENYEMRGEERIEVNARAKALTQTWYVQSETIPLVEQKNVFTGQKKVRTEINLFGKSFAFEKGEPFENAIEDKKEIFSSFLPIKIIQYNLREVKKEAVQTDAETLARQSEIDLGKKLMQQLPQEAKVMDKNVEVVNGDDCITVSVCFLVLEDVAKYQ